MCLKPSLHFTMNAKVVKCTIFNVYVCALKISASISPEMVVFLSLPWRLPQAVV